MTFFLVSTAVALLAWGALGWYAGGSWRDGLRLVGVVTAMLLSGLATMLALLLRIGRFAS